MQSQSNGKEKEKSPGSTPTFNGFFNDTYHMLLPSFVEIFPVVFAQYAYKQTNKPTDRGENKTSMAGVTFITFNLA